MTPSKEMLRAYFDELNHIDEATEWAWFMGGVAAYSHLQSPASKEWREKHGFKED